MTISSCCSARIANIAIFHEILEEFSHRSNPEVPYGAIAAVFDGYGGAPPRKLPITPFRNSSSEIANFAPKP